MARFRERYERAVPPFPAEKVMELVQRQAPWQDMLDLMTATSPLGFFIFFRQRRGADGPPCWRSGLGRYLPDGQQHHHGAPGPDAGEQE